MAEFRYAPVLAAKSREAAPHKSLSAKPEHSMFELCIDQARSSSMDSIKGAFGLTLPEKPLSFTQSDVWRALWVRPSRWLLVSSEPMRARDHAELGERLMRDGHALVDVSHRSAWFSITGGDAVELLSAETILDLRPRSFAPGSVARTRFHDLPVLLCRNAMEDFDLFVGRSHAVTVWRLLNIAASRMQKAASDSETP
ncbi:sarcosine oxidase subunit gamma [Parasphingopyxis sp.]|uniref:sarcosine oxidase subunit gamma n=1 Tax=Parasphingopyxis sp. TaxID=1920299 RepID=UPI0026277582|nr:sarcosine oxidase subunit gamma family protein [Parasphingopyxis sp.]